MFAVGNIISVGCAKFLSKAQAGLGLLSPKGSGRQTTYIAKLLTLLWGLVIVAGTAQAQDGILGFAKPAYVPAGQCTANSFGIQSITASTPSNVCIDASDIVDIPVTFAHLCSAGEPSVGWTNHPCG